MDRQRFLIMVGWVLLAGMDARAESVAEELQKLQGTWHAVAIESEGKRAPREKVVGVRFVIEGNRIVPWKPDVRGIPALVRLNPAQKPKTIDLTQELSTGPRTMAGIYELDDNSLKMCLGERSKTRPREFATKAGSGNTLYFLRREQP